MSIRVKFIALVTLIVVLGFGGSIALLAAKTGTLQQQSLFQLADKTAQSEAARVAITLEKSMKTARTLAGALKGLTFDGHADRAVADAMLRQVLQENPEFVGVYTLWEPDAFDGNDAAYVNASGHDATGRYIPYWTRGSGKVEVEPLVSYDVPGDGDYYLLPKETQKPVITDPYLYPIAGEDVLITSLVVPIMAEGKFLGIAGVDLPLIGIQEEIAKIQPYEGAYADLISAGGLYVSNRNAELLGQDIGDTPEFQKIKSRIREGHAFQVEDVDPATSKRIYRAYAPLAMSDTDTPWSLAVSVPVDVALAPVAVIRNLAIMIGLAASIALVALLFFVLNYMIVRPIKTAAVAAERLARGDLAQDCEVTANDEIGQLQRSLRAMVTKLSHVIGEVRSTADSLSSASKEVSATAQSMSQSSNEQATSVEETSTSIEQMSASIEQNTENAKVTDGMASNAAKQAVEGGAAVKDTVDAMKSIAAKIGIIDDIAYQTNLLALNAAIEAARAGEHGKGFAVVAAEVRKLAERSQVAAQEIGEVAKSSVTLAERAGSLLDEIVPGIAKTSHLVQEITAASAEQSAGVGQINTAMNQLNRITQQNASSSEELVSTAEEMSGQAEQLQQLMGFFTLASHDDGTREQRSAPQQARTTQPANNRSKALELPDMAVPAGFVRFEE